MLLLPWGTCRPGHGVCHAVLLGQVVPLLLAHPWDTLWLSRSQVLAVLSNAFLGVPAGTCMSLQIET